jgi:hypothetical protein
MVTQHVLAMGAGLLLSSVNLQTTNPPALTGIWKSERCVIQERAGTRTSSRSRFVFLDDEWALEPIQYSDAACTKPSLRAFFPRPVSSHTTVDRGAGRLRRRLRIHAQTSHALRRCVACRSES